MSRENILFSIIGVLLGYAVAATFVTYANRGAVATGGALSSAQAQAGAELPPDHPALGADGGAGQAEFRRQLEAAEGEARSDPQSFEAQVRAAGMNADAGDFDDATDFLVRAHELRPEDYETVVLLGNISYEAGRFEVAERWYKEALAKKPDDIEVRTDLGLTYFMREPKRTDDAVAEFRRALQQNPEHERTLHNLTHVLTRKGDLEEAEQTLTRLEKLNPANPDLARLRESLATARTTLKAATERGGGAKRDGKQ
ncbi:MAG TPA: tetratricopeptide repeat protein [Pyrinomonadaceae bacterium]|nr:tetratricopeptide repeat protein [Pyrinomonadaceae bacterium]